jgi:alpha-N-arabinofuranosidase
MASASEKDGVVTLSFVNPHATFPLEVRIEPGASPREVRASILAHDDLAAHNTFDEPETLRPRGVELTPGAEWVYECPPASVNVLQLKI